MELEVVVNNNLSWRMLLVVSRGLTFWTALPHVTIIATSLVALLQFLLRTRRAHISRRRKGSPLIRMTSSPKIMQLMSSRNTTPCCPLSPLYPNRTINTLGSAEVLAFLVPTRAHPSYMSLWVVIVEEPLFSLLLLPYQPF